MYFSEEDFDGLFERHAAVSNAVENVEDEEFTTKIIEQVYRERNKGVNGMLMEGRNGRKLISHEIENFGDYCKIVIRLVSDRIYIGNANKFIVIIRYYSHSRSGYFCTYSNYQNYSPTL